MAKSVKDVDIFSGIGTHTHTHTDTDTGTHTHTQQKKKKEPHTDTRTDTDTHTHTHTHTDVQLPQKAESKTARLQLLVTPTLMQQMDKIAQEAGISRNQLINTVMQDYVNRKGSKK